MALSLLTLSLIGAAAAAQADRNCRDDRGVDRCAQEQQQRQRQLYAADTIEEHAARNEQVRRIFYVDGYGQDLAMISFVRAPGRDILVEVKTAPAAGRTLPPLTAAVPLPAWEEAIAASRHFERPIAPRAGAEQSICLHSWVYTAEAADAPRAGAARPSIRRAVEDACQDGLVQVFAMRLAQQALDLLPPCRLINPAQHRNVVTILAACARLSGDRIAAAQAMNALHAMGSANQPELTREGRAGFGHRVRFDIQGQVTEQEWSRAAAFWLEQRQALGGGFSPMSYHGERWDRVMVRGHLWRHEGLPRPERAPMEIVLGWESTQSYRIQQISVGGFVPLPPAPARPPAT